MYKYVYDTAAQLIELVQHPGSQVAYEATKKDHDHRSQAQQH